MSKFYDLINHSEIPVLVDFYADWCGPCKTMSPIVQDFAKEMSGEVKVLKVDVDKNQQVAMKYQIQGIPTLILFHKGKILWRQSGVVQKPQLIQVIKSFAT
ncbi:thioredoxin [Fulvivirgaceae bacterium BMA10]|uniref:Thioredoxin n=1 Tax=Splendidivirga corallicola TaxID=3051826 RepID=A0ABT8KHW0_9BACT|nr:thioredoxin [Fulvivirgaceae bacterium BMA10]